VNVVVYGCETRSSTLQEAHGSTKFGTLGSKGEEINKTEFHTRQGISSQLEQYLTSEEGICSMELVT
jgi:hypothetical protein